MRKLFLCLGLSLLMITPVLAKTEQVNIGGQKVTLEVQEQSGRRLYPLRAICNALGINIVEIEGSRIQLQQGDNTVYYFTDRKLVANDTGYFVSDVIPLNVNNTVYVPIRTISYMFGYNIDTTNGMALSKVAHFSKPKATYGSNLLMQDVTTVNEIIYTVDGKYYVTALGGVLGNYNWGRISDCKEYIINDKLAIQGLAAELKTQSGQAVYKAYIEFLDAMYDTFYYIGEVDMQKASNSMSKITSATKKIENAQRALLDAVYTVASKVK